MHPSRQLNYERTLSVLATIFILCYFYLFSYDGLHTFFTYDDGMALVSLHRVFDTPLWKNVVEVLQVFTKQFRPLGSLFWRSLYALFGFDPFPYRVIVHCLLVMNIALTFGLARSLGMTKEAATLSTLLFCYNGSMVDLYYNTSTIYDVLCFTFYVGALMVYARGRSGGSPLSIRSSLAVAGLFLAALDSKEIAVTLPAILVAYEVLFHFRDLKSRPVLVKSGTLFALMFVIAAIYSKVKVSHMGQSSNYDPQISFQFILNGYARYLQQLTLRDPEAFTLTKGGIIAGFLLLAALISRSRTVLFSLVFFCIALIPVAIIAPRGAYAAYVAYPGLALAVGYMLAQGRWQLVRLAGITQWDLASAVVLFLCAAGYMGYRNATARKTGMGHMTWDQSKRIDFMAGLKRTIPEFPPNARVLVTEDPWGPDWGPMFLTRLDYHDGQIWMDRVNNQEKLPGLETYDALIKYKEPALDMVPATIFGYAMPWEIRFPVARPGEFTITTANPNWLGRNVTFSPSAVRAGQPVSMTAPGLANVKLNVVYRVLSGGHSKAQTVINWCTLDANGSCTVLAPTAGQVGTMVVDWIQPENQRWIFTTGVLTVVE